MKLLIGGKSRNIYKSKNGSLYYKGGGEKVDISYMFKKNGDLKKQYSKSVEETLTKVKESHHIKNNKKFYGGAQVVMFNDFAPFKVDFTSTTIPDKKKDLMRLVHIGYNVVLERLHTPATNPYKKEKHRQLLYVLLHLKIKKKGEEEEEEKEKNLADLDAVFNYEENSELPTGTIATSIVSILLRLNTVLSALIKLSTSNSSDVARISECHKGTADFVATYLKKYLTPEGEWLEWTPADDSDVEEVKHIQKEKENEKVLEEGKGEGEQNERISRFATEMQAKKQYAKEISKKMEDRTH